MPDFSVSRHLVALIAAALVLTGCPGVEAPPSESSDTEAVLESRKLLGDPMLEVAEATLALSDGIDAARHELARGEQMQEQVERLPALQKTVREAAAAAAAAAEDAPIESAAAIVSDAADRASSAADAAGGEIAFLRQIAEIDTALLEAAAEWDRPGSQSEIRLRLDALSGKVARLKAPLAKAQADPRRCTAMKRNRADWIATVRKRTEALQAQANSAGGTTFDRLRASYRSLPFAVEPRTADKADRQCWVDASEVAQAAQTMRKAVDRLREELSS